MRSMRFYTGALLAMLVLAVGVTALRAQEKAPAEKAQKTETKAKASAAQAACPVTGKAVGSQKAASCQVSAKKTAKACCAGDGAKATAASLLTAGGAKPEPRIALCSKCGHIKGTGKCCTKDAVKCSGCKLAKGSPGCCKHLKPAAGETNVLLCAKCGQVKGAEKCCAKDAAKCSKCGLAKGSPGCCNVPKTLIDKKPGTKDAAAERLRLKAEETKRASGSVVELAKAEELGTLLAGQNLVLVDFYATWCGPCRSLKPTIHKIAKDYAGDVRVVQINVDRFPKLASKYGVSGIPDVKLFQKGKVHKAWTGAYPEKAYTGVLDKLVDGKALSPPSPSA